MRIGAPNVQGGPFSSPIVSSQKRHSTRGTPHLRHKAILLAKEERLKVDKNLSYVTLVAVTWNDTWKRRTAALQRIPAFAPSVARAGTDMVGKNESNASIPRPLTVFLL